MGLSRIPKDSIEEISEVDNVSQVVGFKNKIINGDFQLSQRGNYTSATALDGNAIYYLDRFTTALENMSGNLTHNLNQAISTSNTTNTVRIDFTQTTSTGVLLHRTKVEDCIKLRGQTLTISAKVKGTIPNCSFIIYDGIAETYYEATNYVNSGSWTEVSASISIDSSATGDSDGALLVYITSRDALANNGTLTSGEYLEFTQFQLEEGSVATKFESRLYAVELALCQRYYEKIDYVMFEQGSLGDAGRLLIINGVYKTTKRIAIEPTIYALNAGNTINSISNYSNGNEITGINYISNPNVNNLGSYLQCLVAPASPYSQVGYAIIDAEL